MQILIQTVCTRGRSLREAIVGDQSTAPDPGAAAKAPGPLGLAKSRALPIARRDQLEWCRHNIDKRGHSGKAAELVRRYIDYARPARTAIQGPTSPRERML